MKLDFRSLRAKTWLYFILFATIILAVLWLLQIIFIKVYYKDMKINEVVKIGKNIVDNYDTDTIADNLNQLAFNNNIFITIYDEQNNILVSSDFFGGDGRFDKNEKLRPPIANFRNFKRNLTEKGETSLYYVDSKSKMDRLFYGSVFKDENNNELCVFITAGLPPIDATIDILKNQFVIVTIILFLLAFFIAYLFSKNISKPVMKLTKTARQLADGNLDAVFEKGNFSEIDELADTLNYATKEMSRVDSLRKDLIANISHDLRTPITVIKMYSEMIRDVSWENPVKRNEHIALIIKESDRLSSLVNEILQLSISQSESFNVDLKVFNLSDTIYEVVKQFDVLTQKEGFVFNLEIENNVFTKADEEQIKRVLYNLIGNAINYTGDNKTITICLKTVFDKILVEIIDTGCGIEEEELHNIWERYYKANKTHKRAIIGTGLGLSIVKQILKHHDARFGVRSVVGEGSTFWFELCREGKA